MEAGAVPHPTQKAQIEVAKLVAQAMPLKGQINKLKDMILLTSTKLDAQHGANMTMALSNARIFAETARMAKSNSAIHHDCASIVSTVHEPDRFHAASPTRMDAHHQASMSMQPADNINLTKQMNSFNIDTFSHDAASGSQGWCPQFLDQGEKKEPAEDTLLPARPVSASCSASHESPTSPKPEDSHSTGRPIRSLPADTTTLVVRNIPARYNQDKLLQEWNHMENGFDLLHLPYSIRMRRNVGYVFLNFKTNECALSFHERWHGAMLADHGNGKRLDITHAPIQGFKRNLQSLRSRGVERMNSKSHQPAIFDEMGNRVDMREALDKIAQNA